MNSTPARLSAPREAVHPAVLSRRMRELLLMLAATVIPLALALAISVAVPQPSVPELLGIAVGVLGVVSLMVSSRYELTVTIVVLYLGLLEGPVKLGIGGHETVSAVRDVLIFAVCLGAVLRLFVRRERIALPPLSAWVFAYVAIVLVEAFNPHTHGITKSLGGFRQLLEWVPFFFFGYALIRSKRNLRRAFLILGVIALANGLVSGYQARLSPTQLASWGPGYHELALGTKGLGGRTYKSEGVARVRPPGLGTDAGFAGGLAVIALPATLALAAIGRRRRRWPVVLLCLGAVIAAVSGLGRLQAIGAIIATLAFAGLTLSSAGRRAMRPLMTLAGVMLIALPLGVALISANSGAGTFSRYESIVTGEHSDNKLPGLTHIPNQLSKAPFGVGLGVAGAAAGFGGLNTEQLEGRTVSAETQYNFLADELGVLGLVLWIAFTIKLLLLAISQLRRVRDTELLMALAALSASFVAITVMGFYGPTLTSAALGAFFWFFAGVASYWFAGPGREMLREVRPAEYGRPALAGVGSVP